jgi:hypothetical protein
MAEEFFIVRTNGLREMMQRTERMEKNYVPAVERAMRGLAKLYKERVQKAISAGAAPGPPLSRFTITKRRFGKLAGAGGPAIPAYGGQKPWLRSGILLRSIRFKRMSKKRWSVYPEARPSKFAGGKTVTTDYLAGLLEYGFTVSIPETMRMRRYLFKLFQKSAGSGGSGGRKYRGFDSRQTGRTLTVRVPPRPVFHWVNDQLYFTYSEVAKKEFEKVFWRGL